MTSTTGRFTLAAAVAALLAAGAGAQGPRPRAAVVAPRVMQPQPIPQPPQATVNRFVVPPTRATPNPGNYYIAPGLTVNQAAYNAAVLGRAYQQIPPWLYGYNPYPPPIITTAPYVGPYAAFQPFPGYIGNFSPYYGSTASFYYAPPYYPYLR